MAMGIPDLKPIVAAMNRMADAMNRLAAATEQQSEQQRHERAQAYAKAIEGGIVWNGDERA